MKNELISQNDDSTIIAQYVFVPKESRGYQSEAELEEKFIQDLDNQGYEYVKHIRSTQDLKDNLKIQLEKLNHITLSQAEWERFYKQVLTNPNKTREDKTEMIQTDLHTELLERDDGSYKNIKLIDREDIFKNTLQVISQLENNDGDYKNRYDVSILVNGLPLVHIELKKRGLDLKEAFNQIKRYSRESFSEGDGLFEFVQIFVISNGTLTRYYSNSTRSKVLKDNEKNTNKGADNFAFCMAFSDLQNNIINEFEDFTKTFFAKRTLLHILTKFCVFNTDKQLLVMRPYQIAASEAIIRVIKSAHANKLYGSINAGGYIWHSTGSGKTLTSFKTALLATKLEFVKKVLFVVDRKDLDYQTMKEYDQFQKDSANATKNTQALKRLIESDKNDEKIIITTIQKLANFVGKYFDSEVFQKEIVFIFDECHRSQFGKMHEQIKKQFKKYYIFGFTGTPIFQENAAKNYTTIKEKDAYGGITQKAALKTTDVIFGEKLHSYTILNAIRDKNVLPFNVSYISTMKEKENISDEEVESIEKKEALLHPDRISKIVQYILENFDRLTKRNESYKFGKKNISGFNSIFATESVEFAKTYYEEFKKQLALQENPIKVGIIYSYAPNEDVDDEIDEGADSVDSKTFLENAIKDYNQMFGSQFSLNDFDQYYKNISQRLKEKELDLLIVVNMFLTGFDSKTINTLWVDKNLRHHGLLQSFSRTNRILNDVKAFGNIVCFRNLENATNESLKMFGDEDSRNIVLLRSFQDYLNGYTQIDGTRVDGYNQLVEKLKEKFDLKNFPLQTSEEQKEFTEIFNGILRLRNILEAFDEFEEQDCFEKGLAQDYLSHYRQLYQDKRGGLDKVSIEDDLIFEIDLLKQVDINVDYILFLLQKYTQDKEQSLKEKILKMLDSSIGLHNKRDLIEAFLERIDKGSDEGFDKLFEEFIQERQKEELEKIIQEENLNESETKKYIQTSFEINHFREVGGDIGKVFGKRKLFTLDPKEKEANNTQRKRVILKLREFFEKFRDVMKQNDGES